MSDFNLTENFTHIDHDDWINLVEKGLKGAGLQSLSQLAENDIARGPLSTLSDRPESIAPLPRTGVSLLNGRPWHITAPVGGPDITLANQQILEDLSGGASALRLTLGEDGVLINSNSEMKRLLDQVYTGLIAVIAAPHSNADIIDLFSDYKSAHLRLGLSVETDGLAKLAKDIPDTWQLLTINAARIHDMGGTMTQELAFFAASAAKAFRILGADAAKHINAELSTDQDGHMGIAKLRAARRIYTRIAESFGVKNAPLSLHVISSQRMMQSTDPWTNMLRVMSAGFGAIIGGADFITLRPFTDTIGHATPFGHRIARNMQLMMMEESHLGHVQDAAFGSYFHERMTDALANKAWQAFQTIESGGGLDNLEDFYSGVQFAAQRRKDTNEPILGVTLHPLGKDSSAYREAKVRKSF